jgi:eukaryotic-like serine/threonine-protein kinase
MKAERWRQIEEIFQAAFDSAPENRAALLDSACGDDLELRSEVESLLAAHEQSGFTAGVAFNDVFSVLEQRAGQLEEGRRMGPYRLLREIGHGGMGRVYLAARADDAYQKLVAIKVIRRGLDTDDIIRRFHSERQILASLDHPNITRLLDGGTTEDGLPYFVMEYIDGEPIDEYCASRKINISDRLRLFQKVCAAVSYAHQNLVIHRDIKPGNVLVTKGGVPRLLDFGIAKLLAPGGPREDGTLTSLRPLTPEYASPEQVRGRAITTASDVYSLGVLLYVLLTRHLPYRAPMSTAAEIERAICEEEPGRPSLVVMRASCESAESKEQILPDFANGMGEGTLDKLCRRLEGDLDNIVLMALRKEPQRRYTSVEQLSDDLGRHLGNTPVIARPNTAGYRAGKFVVRHKSGVAAALLLLITLSAGIGATAWQARTAAAESKRARIEAARAQRISGFLQDMLSFSSPAFGSSNPHKNPDAKVSEVVEQAARHAENELANQPEVLAEVQRTIGEVYYAQGRYDQAEQVLRAARRNYIRVYGGERQESVEASIFLANALLRKGNLAEAESLFRDDIQIERKAAQRGRLDIRLTAYALGDYGSMLDQEGSNAAGTYLQEALQYASRFRGKDRAYVAMLYNDLGDVAYRGGDLKGAERFNRAALDEYRKLPGGGYVEMGATLSNLGAILIKEGRYTEAEPFVRESLALRRKLLGNAHPDTAMSLFRLSDLLYREANYAGAESAARESIEVFKHAFARPNNALYFAAPLTELGLILNKTGHSREAEAYLREALAIRVRLLAAGNQLIGTTEGALGECLASQKRYATAEPLLLDSYKIMKSTAGEPDPRTIEAIQRLVIFYQSWVKPRQAADYVALLRQSKTGMR